MRKFITAMMAVFVGFAPIHIPVFADGEDIGTAPETVIAENDTENADDPANGGDTDAGQSGENDDAGVSAEPTDGDYESAIPESPESAVTENEEIENIAELPQAAESMQSPAVLGYHRPTQELPASEYFDISFDGRLGGVYAVCDDLDTDLTVLEAFVVTESYFSRYLIPSLVTMPELKEGESLSLYGIGYDGSIFDHPVMENMAVGDSIRLPLTWYKGFALVKEGEAVQEDVTIRSSGDDYSVAVTYGADANIRKEVHLETSEYDGEDFDMYKMMASTRMLANDFDYIRILDIAIEDADSEHVTPEGEVTVTVELADIDPEEEVQVIHFGEETEVLDAEVDGTSITFRTESFSAYAIVQGPDAQTVGWNHISDMDEFAERAADGFYLGHPSGYYMMGTQGNINASRTGISKTKPAQFIPDSRAVKYYFESAGNDRYYVYNMEGGIRHYLRNAGNNSLSLTTSESEKTAFVMTVNNAGEFNLHNGVWYVNMQGGANGNFFACYNNSNDANNKLYFWYHEEIDSDPLGLNGTTYGFMNYNEGVTGRAMMASSTQEGALDVLPLTVMTKKNDIEDKLFVPNDSDITLWTFHWIDDDKYYITADVGGETKYLSVTPSGLFLKDIADASCELTVTAGTGTHTGELSIGNGDTVLTYSGSAETGFGVGGQAGSEWLKLVDLSELTNDYVMTYSATKVSVSDTSVTNGSRIIVYTRTWDPVKKKYVLYAIDHDGSLVPVYDGGSDIQWTGTRINTLLWNFVEYYDETTGNPTYYYELYNQYSEKFIAPLSSGGSILSDEPVGINMTGRRSGYYHTPIIAWDEDNYAYTALKENNHHLEAVPLADADDFYFAVIQDLPVDDELTLVPTVDHTLNGITMKIVNFPSNAAQNAFLNSSAGGANVPPTQGLLSTNLGTDGYPIGAGGSMAQLYAGETEVNNLFIKSIYDASGYFEFDSTQNFASLDKDEGKFKVYKELGTMDISSRPSLKHGQFMPYNDIEAGVYASVNNRNTHDAMTNPLPASDPRKNEQMYLVKNPDYYFGLDIEAPFTQTPNGLDEWGHDIIFDFTGDDDFWLYVDGELIIDLGGIHSALPGSVNYSTGIVSVNGEEKTLRQIFESNYRTRNPQASDAAVNAFLSEYFEDGSTIFKDYSNHTMRIFFMERGAGASNLRMHFNLTSIRPGSFLLSKRVTGVDDEHSLYARYPYQIWYQQEDDEGNIEEKLLTQTDQDIHVYYKDTIRPVTFRRNYTVGGVTYNNVFLLRPGEVADVQMPDETLGYRVVECGIPDNIYDEVYVNDELLEGTPATGSQTMSDYGIDYDTTANRSTVAYNNHVDPDALHILTIKKILYDETGTQELHNDPTKFNYRLFFGDDEDSLVAANMYSYRVKNELGEYCTWNSSTKSFVSTGISDFSQLTPQQKRKTAFTTSMNGAISKIPAFYTVEIRDLLTGTHYKVIERADEIPDGYALQKYVIYDDVDDLTGTEDGANGQGEFEEAKDPHVDVCNLRGWGLRLKKYWTDADYMSARNDAYFAVYDVRGGTPVMVEGTLRRLQMKEKELYWYFETLPASATLSDYEIREVMLSNTPDIDADGNLINYGTITPVEPNGEVQIEGKQKGETETSLFTYKSLYEKGNPEPGANVRVDEMTNNRPGIVLKKHTADGSPLANVKFTLKDNEGNVIGNFTSDSTGEITVAFLRDGIDYTLTETATVQGYRGLTAPVIIRLQNGTVSVSGIDQDDYVLEQGVGITPTLTLINRPYDFKAIKLDSDTRQPLEGVHFALHKQVTVGNVTVIDPNPMIGYSDLVTDEDGYIPLIDNTLPAGTYELREKSTLSNYQLLGSYIRFTIGPSGVITLGTHPEEASLTSEVQQDGSVEALMTILNHADTALAIRKTVTGNMGSKTKQFVFTLNSVEDQPATRQYDWKKTDYSGAVTTGKIRAGETFTIADSETVAITLPIGKQVTITEANENYQTTWEFKDQPVVSGNTKTLVVEQGGILSVTNHLNVTMPTNAETHQNAYLWLFAIMALLISSLFISNKKRSTR